MTLPKVFPAAALCAAVVFSGCRSDDLELYKPASTEVYKRAPVGETARVRDDRPRVALETNLGTIVIELFEEEAPVSTRNFLRYVNDEFYDGTIFHRVIPGFVVQGGGFTPDMEEKETYDPISNEAGNGMRNYRGTVAMARAGNDMNSATSQFFINLVDNNRFLDGDGKRDGYAVFGRVVEGMDVVDRISFVQTGASGRHEDVPEETVVIEDAYVVENQ